ncbi:MAG: CRISPR-associated endonuclease Cas1 [Chloroflexota bacterium]|nr:CRISPR-associated endonuclease Cas1 [Chloroflexota bacterium]
MHDESSPSTGALPPPRNGVLVLTGYGIRVAVERGHLTISDGQGRERRAGRFPRSCRSIRRLVVIGHTGTISFEALRWLSDVGATFVQIDRDGEVIAATGPVGLDDARLRRAQAIATTNGTGVVVARDLLTQKLAGQAALLDRLGTEQATEAASRVRQLANDLVAAGTPDRLRLVEAQAAASYWGVWAGVPVRFGRRDTAKVPEDWQAFDGRASPLSGASRRAATPANAILNYLYAILECEARIACAAVGLDPGLGVLHADLKARDSLALDVMEVIRPQVDGFVLDLMRTRTFAARDFFETREGGCRLMPSLAKLLAETGSQWAAALGPVVERVAQLLMGPAAAKSAMPTPLTQANRSAGRDGLRRGERQKRMPDAALPAACLMCGLVLERTGRDYCDGCLPDYRAEQATESFGQAGPSALTRLRAEGTDPAHGGEAGRKRGERNAAHVAAVARWEGAGDEPTEPDAFARDILPRLRAVPLRLMAEATGLSLGYCSFVRRGQKVPHRRHWGTLARLSDDHGRR